MDVNIQELIEVLRYERPVIWVGAGFSRVAGLPCAKELAEELCKEIGKRRGVEANDLPEVAAEYEKKYSREKLDEFLVHNLSKESVNLDYHRALMDIPQIEEIITTNYDTLLERNSKLKKMRVIRGYRERFDLLGVSSPSINIYKVHGCITEPSSIIITTKDYSRMKSEIKSTPVWHKMYSLVCERKVIILGYSFRDEEILEMLRNSCYWINTNQKVKYCIDINMNADLQERLKYAGIRGIQGDIREIAQQLYKKTTEEVVKDTLAGIMPISIATKVIEAQGFLPEWQSRGEGATVKSLKPLGGAQLKGQLEIKAGSPTIELVQRAMRNETIDSVIVTKDDIARTSLKAGLVELLAEGIELIKITPLPTFTSNVALLVDEETVLAKMKMDVYQSQTHPTIKLSSSNFELRFRMDSANNRCQTQYTIGENCDSIVIKNLARLLKGIGNDKKLSIRSDDGKIDVDLPRFKIIDGDIDEQGFKRNVDRIFEVARTIVELEVAYNIRIPFPLAVSEEEYKQLRALLMSRGKKNKNVDRCKIEMTLEDCNAENVINEKFDVMSFRLYSDERKKVRIIGQDFDLGYLVLCASEMPVEEVVLREKLTDRRVRIGIIVKNENGKLCSYYSNDKEDSIFVLPPR